MGESKKFDLYKYLTNTGLSTSGARQMYNILKEYSINSQDQIDCFVYPHDRMTRNSYVKNDFLISIKTDDISGIFHVTDTNYGNDNGIWVNYVQLYNQKENSYFKLDAKSRNNDYYGFIYNRICKNIPNIKDGLYCVRYEEEQEKSILSYYENVDSINIGRDLLKVNPEDYDVKPDIKKIWNNESYSESAWQCLNNPNLIQEMDKLQDFSTKTL